MLLKSDQLEIGKMYKVVSKHYYWGTCKKISITNIEKTESGIIRIYFISLEGELHNQLSQDRFDAGSEVGKYTKCEEIIDNKEFIYIN